MYFTVKQQVEHLRKAVQKKLCSSRAETLAELLVSVLVTALGLMMFATALMTAQQMMTRGENRLQDYYAERNELDSQEYGVEAVLILEEAGKKKSLGFWTEDKRGCYPIELFSDLENRLELYRYTRREWAE